MRLHLAVAILAACPAASVPSPLPAADWPQFMRHSEHTGHAAGEELRLPLGLADGRVFWPSAASGVVYCWEPAKRP